MHSGGFGNTGHLDKEIDLSGSEGLNGMILTASTLCDGFMTLDEEVAKFHLPALGEHLTVFAQEHEIVLLHSLNALSTVALKRAHLTAFPVSFGARVFIAEADPKPPCLRPTSSHAKAGRFMGLGGSGTPDNYEPCPLGTSSRSSATACTNRLHGILNNFDILDCASCQGRFCDDGVGLTLCRQ